MFKEDKEYQIKYGNLPDTTEELAKLIEDSHRLNYEWIESEKKRISEIPWHEVSITIPIVPKGSPRPRQGKYGNFYVKGAKKTKKRIKKFIKELGLICTRIDYTLEVYEPMPSGMTVNEKYLAETKYILPVDKPDWDNVAKTFTDALEGTLLLNDNLINPGCVKKYYSIKPRVNIFIKYQDDYDSRYNKKKIESSIGYINAMGGEELD